MDHFRDSADTLVVGAGQLLPLGGYIHILLVIALVVLVIRPIQGRPVA